MKRVLLLLMVFACACAQAANIYHVKAAGGTGSGLSDGAAWSGEYFTLAQLTIVGPGDQVLFKRGDTIVCKIQVENANIRYGAYGTGAKPVLTAFKRLTTWTPAGGNIYTSSINLPFKLNAVKLDGQLTAMGRYPQTGFMIYTAHVGNSSITSSAVPGVPFNPAGAQLVNQKAPFITDRNNITSRSGSTLNVTAGNEYGTNGQYEPVNGNGMFIQDHIGTLTYPGAWVYDTLSNNFSMYFTGTPGTHDVCVSMYDKNVQLNYWTGIQFTDLTFEGGNDFGGWNIGTSNILYDRCDFINQGGNAFWASFLDNITLQNGNITNSLDNGVYFVEGNTNVTIKKMTLQNIGMIPGAAKSGDGSQNGMAVVAEGMLIDSNSLNLIGYNGINFTATNNAVISNNTINNFCAVKSDGGGIYTYNANGTLVNRLVINNTITNALGTLDGIGGFFHDVPPVAGAYLDEHSDHTTVRGNTITNGPWIGIFLNNVEDSNRIYENTVSGYPEQLHITAFTPGKTRGTDVYGNNFNTSGSQLSVFIHFYNSETPQDISYFRQNVYDRPVEDIFRVKYQTGTDEYYNLSEWLNLYFPADANITKTYRTITNRILVTITGKLIINK